MTQAQRDYAAGYRDAHVNVNPPPPPYPSEDWIAGFRRGAACLPADDGKSSARAAFEAYPEPHRDKSTE